ncbi:NEAT domain-containing protein [Halalkalibacterium halodurans]|uniref:NEAT domain-containing protein n=1 Tax=Halalkalibacterium halodurans TaxID=86665 RepID=UPI002E1D7334|nr:NEAT domain-containing protein [Halalkalibacterium halodurans]MED4084477.1 NEAT domain-containing protein [Halalkalibacterium halodurans]MED4104927.1 NEAT domain-containing protein [Halalkalibacterium halodurans]MED4107432.1 NEAT domain-containing protein [Halalkalibacterium halodurans]MED4125682.1 NEAT domain-containing protein [Halalkalibacterium halodurans]
MKRKWQKLLSILSVWMILFASFAPSIAGAAEANSLANGEYTIDFKVLKDGTNETSVMNGYTAKPATVFINGNDTYVEVTLTQSDWIKVFQTRQNGTFVDAEVVSEDPEANTRIVRFPVEDLATKLDAYTHVVIPMINYDNWYTVQFQFDENSLTPVNVEQPGEEENGQPEEEITEPGEGESGQPEEEITEPGEGESGQPEEEITEPGEGESGQSEEEVTEPDEEESSQPEEEATEPGEGEEESPELEDGTYTIDFRALRADNDNLSSMDGYLGKPALLEVEGGKTFVSLTINEREGQFLTDVRLHTNGEWTSGAVVSEDPENLSRVVKYEVANIAAVIDAEVDMYVPRANYSNTQKFRLAFDVHSITEVEEEQPEEPVEPEQPSNETELAVGEYTIDFMVLKDGTNDTSVMDGYTEKPAHLTVEEAGAYVDLTLTNSDWIKLFQTKQNGTFVDAEVVSEDAEANKRVVRFPIDNVHEQLDAYTHVVIPMINYDNYYTVQLSFDVNSLKPADNESETPEVPEVIPPKVVEGDGGKFSLVIQDVRNFTYDSGKKRYEIGHRNVTAYEISSEIFAQLNHDASVSFAIGDDVTAIFPVGFLQSQFAGEESITFSFHEVTDAKITEGAVSKVYDFNVYMGDKEITQFADPVTLNFAVDGQLVNKWDQLQVVYINDAGEKAEFINPTNIDSNGQTVTAHVSHFSTFGVFETASEEEEETPTTGLPNGTYTIDFTVLKHNTNEVSVMDNYTEKPATLVVQDGQQTIDLTLTNSDWIKLFQTKQNGEYVDAEVVSADTAANKRVVRFDVQDLSAKQSAYTHVVIPELQYDNFYEVHIRFDTNSIRDEDGNIVTPNPNPNPAQPGPTVPSQPSPTNPSNPGGGQLPEEGLKDGEYTIDFTVLKNNTNEVSVMDDYTVKPAILSVENQETYVTVTLKNSEWIKVFQTEQDGTYVDAEIVSVNAVEDTRDVRFYVEDLEELVHAYTEVYFEEPILYDGKYFVQFDFDVHSITPLGEGGIGSGNNEKGSGNGTGSAEEDNLSFTRDNGGSQPTTAERVTNSKTADTAMIGLLILLLAGSAFWLIRKYRLGTL